MIHKGRVKDGPMGWYLCVSPGGIDCYRWRRWFGDAENHHLKSFAKAPGGVWGGPCEGDFARPDPHLPSFIPALSRAGYTKGDNSQN